MRLYPLLPMHKTLFADRAIPGYVFRPDIGAAALLKVYPFSASIIAAWAKRVVVGVAVNLSVITYRIGFPFFSFSPKRPKFGHHFRRFILDLGKLNVKCGYLP